MLFKEKISFTTIHKFTGGNIMTQVTRLCHCGGIAIEVRRKETKDPVELHARELTALVRCGCCHKTFRANVGRLEEWELAMEDRIDFYIRRKRWARNLLKDQGLIEPRQSTKGIFEGSHFSIIIGPRRGIKITEIALF